MHNNHGKDQATIQRAQRFCCAPMMRYSHAAARRFWRLLCPPALLYTEMLMAESVIHGHRQRLLDFSSQHPVALQLGGANIQQLTTAAQIGEDYGAAEINLNCGCPSPRAQCGGFGACLMKNPALIGRTIAALKSKIALPVTVKCRIAVDDMNDGDDLDNFARAVLNNGGDALILHARRALLRGLNPAQNRTAPPLNYARAQQLKESFGDFPIILNGGIANTESVVQHLQTFDGVMAGRAVVKNPYWLASIATDIFGVAAPARRDVLQLVLEDVAANPRDWRRMVSAVAGLFRGEKNGGRFRRCLSLPQSEALPLLREYCIS